MKQNFTTVASFCTGCHLFCTTRLSSNYLRVVVAIKSKVVMLVWKYLAETSSSTTNCTPATPKLESYNPVEGFVKHRVSNDYYDIARTTNMDCEIEQIYECFETLSAISADSYCEHTFKTKTFYVQSHDTIPVIRILLMSNSGIFFSVS